jgi:beta-lactamase superfamily II metal-dependent hydrolase
MADEFGYEVDFLPVGNGEKSGDAIALRFGNLLGDSPKQTVFVIDGGYQESGEKLVAHIKEYYKTNRVDVVVSTHPDNDHTSGLEVVLNKMEVGCLLMHLPWKHAEDITHLFEDQRITDEGLQRRLKESLEKTRSLEKLANEKKIRIVEPFWGVTGYDNAMRVLGPTEDYYKQLLPGYRGTPQPKEGLSGIASRFFEEAKEVVKKIAEDWGVETLDDSGESSSENNSSAILLFTFGQESLLFTSDAGIPALTEVVARLKSEGFDFGKLKFIQVPHHGSRRNIGPTLLNDLVGPCLVAPQTLKTVFASVSPDGAPKHPCKKV